METRPDSPEPPQYTGPPDRPPGVSCLASLTAIGGIIVLLIGLMLLAIPADQIQPGAEGLVGLSALLILAGAGLSFAVAWGLWSLKKWAWYVSLTLEVLGIGLYAIQLLSGTNTLAEIIVSGIVVYYLYRPHVRQAFDLD
jgi:phosphatidylserine synthase